MNEREARESGLRLKASVAPISLKKSASFRVDGVSEQRFGG
jgi:hypothetical protein